MKDKQLIRLVCVLGAAAIFMGGAAALSRRPAEVFETAAPAKVQNSKYIVREYMGMIAVFSGEDENKILTLTDYPVSVLPKADRESLSEGIAINDDKELAMLLEDYQS